MTRKKIAVPVALARASRRFDLTERETEVAGLWIRANTVSGAADALKISVHTVIFHIRNIYRKFNVHCQAEFFLRVYLPDDVAAKTRSYSKK